MSKPRSFDAETIQTLLDALRNGSFLGPACRSAGISRSTLYRWLERGRSNDSQDAPYRAFRRDYQAAIAEAEINALQTIRRAGSEGISGSWQANAWFLERRFPARWRRKPEVDEFRPLKPFHEMTDEELEAIAGSGSRGRRSG